MLTHDFLLLPEKDDSYGDYAEHVHDPKAFRVADDLVLYMMDTMRWIPSINPANPDEWSGYGLNYHGPTVINYVGAAKAARVFRLWASLMQEGPVELELTGSYEWRENGSADLGQYAKITLPRDAVVKMMSEIASLAEAAISGQFYVLHLGV